MPSVPDASRRWRRLSGAAAGGGIGRLLVAYQDLHDKKKNHGSNKEIIIQIITMGCLHGTDVNVFHAFY